MPGADLNLPFDANGIEFKRQGQHRGRLSHPA